MASAPSEMSIQLILNNANKACLRKGRENANKVAAFTKPDPCRKLSQYRLRKRPETIGLL